MFGIRNTHANRCTTLASQISNIELAVNVTLGSQRAREFIPIALAKGYRRGPAPKANAFEMRLLKGKLRLNIIKWINSISVDGDRLSVLAVDPTEKNVLSTLIIIKYITALVTVLELSHTFSITLTTVDLVINTRMECHTNTKSPKLGWLAREAEMCIFMWLACRGCYFSASSQSLRLLSYHRTKVNVKRRECLRPMTTYYTFYVTRSPEMYACALYAAN